MLYPCMLPCEAQHALHHNNLQRGNQNHDGTTVEMSASELTKLISDAKVENSSERVNNLRIRYYSAIIVSIVLVGALTCFWESSMSNWDPLQKLSAAAEARMEQRADRHEKNKKIELKKKSQVEECGNDYANHTLKLAYEMALTGLFRDDKGKRELDATDIALIDDEAYVVLDNSIEILKVGVDLLPFTKNNIRIGNPILEDEEKLEGLGYESILYNTNTFYAIQQSRLYPDKKYHAVVEGLSIKSDDYDIVSSCPSQYIFESESDGFQGGVLLRGKNNSFLILALCKHNLCSENEKNEIGNGQIVAMRKAIFDDGSCQWSTIRVINLPKSVDFVDFSSMSINEENGMVVISSQEESKVWIGQLIGKRQTKKEKKQTKKESSALADSKVGVDDDQGGLWYWDANEIAFDENISSIYSFPKNDQCQTKYCNVNGVQWMNNDMIIAVSGKMNSSMKQDFRCFDKDQSVHVFAIP